MAVSQGPEEILASPDFNRDGDAGRPDRSEPGVSCRTVYLYIILR